MKKLKKTTAVPARPLARRVRAARCKKIRDAQIELESCLLTMKQHYGVEWTDLGFDKLYYLVRLARKAP